MSSVASYLRGWWRPRSRQLYLPVSNTVRSPHTTLSMYSKLHYNDDKKSSDELVDSIPTGRPAPPSMGMGFCRRAGRFYTTIIVFSLFLNAIMVYFTFNALSSPDSKAPIPSAVSVVCPAPLPNIFAVDPPSTSRHSQIHDAVQSFEGKLLEYFQSTQNTDRQLDSVSVAIVTPKGSLVEAFHGRLKADDPFSSTPVDRNSIYRIASVSKLFTALETFILREKGALNLDDKVSRFMDSEDARLNNVTIRQLLSHMSGIGRDWPPGDATNHWPHTLEGKGPPPYSGMPMPNREILLDALQKNEWVSDPYTYPVYSNTGYSILGLVNRLANKLKENQELSHAKLLERDVFQRLGFTGSSFSVADDRKHRAAVSSSAPWETTLDFGVSNPAIGQFSSLSDFVLLGKTLLNSTDPNNILPPVVMREWLRPLHNEWDGYTSVGMPWEIIRRRYTLDKSMPKNKTISMYQKLGDIFSHQAGVTLLPTRSIAIVILTTGKMALVDEITELAVDQLMPALDSVLAEDVEKQLGGRWVSFDETTSIELEVSDGGLYAVEYKINGTDALATLQGNPTKKMALWSTGHNYYRLSPSRSSDDGCMPYWIGLDAFPYSNGAPVNMLHLSRHSHRNPETNVLNIPSMKLNLRRIKD